MIFIRRSFVVIETPELKEKVTGFTMEILGNQE